MKFEVGGDGNVDDFNGVIRLQGEVLSGFGTSVGVLKMCDAVWCYI